MPIEKWSEHITIARLATDPHFNDDIQTLHEQASENSIDMVLDLSAVKYINSSHIARMLKLRKQVVGGGRRLMLCAVDSQVWGTFLVTGLDKVFEFADTVPTALASLQLTQQSGPTQP
jgi:anti-anti-sigma factor